MTALQFAEKIQYELDEYDESGHIGINTQVLAEKLTEFVRLQKEDTALKSQKEIEVKKKLLRDGEWHGTDNHGWNF